MFLDNTNRAEDGDLAEEWNALHDPAALPITVPLLFAALQLPCLGFVSGNITCLIDDIAFQTYF